MSFDYVRANYYLTNGVHGTEYQQYSPEHMPVLQVQNPSSASAEPEDETYVSAPSSIDIPPNSPHFPTPNHPAGTIPVLELGPPLIPVPANPVRSQPNDRIHDSGIETADDVTARIADLQYRLAVTTADNGSLDRRLTIQTGWVEWARAESAVFEQQRDAARAETAGLQREVARSQAEKGDIERSCRSAHSLVKIQSSQLQGLQAGKDASDRAFCRAENEGWALKSELGKVKTELEDVRTQRDVACLSIRDTHVKLIDEREEAEREEVSRAELHELEMERIRSLRLVLDEAMAYEKEI